MFDWNDSTVLVTGGTGSFGQTCVATLLQKYSPRKVIVFSRDELKQHEMAQRFPESRYEAIRYFLGDIRDRDRLHRAFRGVDVVIHAAALKQVPACEYNPFEAIMTNVLGAKNIIDCSIDAGVKRVIALSSDKAVSPVNLYGATKLCMEKLFVQGNAYAGVDGTRFACVRYGNVVGSRGSVVPLFELQRASGRLTVTDERMTRFWITLPQGVSFVLNAAEQMHGGEIFVPKIASMRIVDLASAMAPGCQIEFAGIRPGEKLHEVLVSEDEARHTVEYDDMYVICPLYAPRAVLPEGKPLADDFRYASNSNDRWLTADAIRAMINDVA